MNIVPCMCVLCHVCSGEEGEKSSSHHKLNESDLIYYNFFCYVNTTNLGLIWEHVTLCVYTAVFAIVCVYTAVFALQSEVLFTESTHVLSSSLLPFFPESEKKRALVDAGGDVLCSAFLCVVQSVPNWYCVKNTYMYVTLY